jgi:protein-S-isoprenylcysteine O-methyltransferase
MHQRRRLVIRNEQGQSAIFQHNHEIFNVLLSAIPIAIILGLCKLLDLIQISNTFVYLFLVGTIYTLSNIGSFVALFYRMNFAVYWRSAVILNVFSVGLLISTQSTRAHMRPFGFYLMCLATFHLSEYLFTALFNYRALRVDSFLLNHSFEYKLAALLSWSEYFVEMLVWPDMKMNSYMCWMGIGLIVFGEICRKLAMYTAGKSFNHLVQDSKADDHTLVTNGIYSIVRHPSYFGWFYWSIGTQVLLANPICIIGYTLASWKFFHSRILYEEYYLIKFFGQQYIDYQARVSIGIPFIKGYRDIDEPLD